MEPDDPIVNTVLAKADVEPDTLTVLSMVTWREIVTAVLNAADEAGVLSPDARVAELEADKGKLVMALRYYLHDHPDNCGCYACTTVRGARPIAA